MRLVALLACVAVATGCTPAEDAFGRPLHPVFEHDSLPVAANGGKFVEYYWKRPLDWGVRHPVRHPVLVFLHGHQEGHNTPGGKAFVDFGMLDSAMHQGYIGVSISQPGYGQSAGPPDFMGPATVAAIEAVIEHFRAQPFVRGDRIALEGVSRGAIAASLVAVSDTTIRAMVLISGEYDFATPIDATTPVGRLARKKRDVVQPAINAETDGSLAALQARSALLHADRIRTAALLFNGQDDDRTDATQAQALAERLRANGVDARSIVYPSVGHAIPFARREQEIRPFLAKLLER